MTAPPATRRGDPRAIADATRGFVLGVDLYGPFTPDVDGNVWAMVGVEVGHTDWGMVRLMTDKDSDSCKQALMEMRAELRSQSKHTTMDVV